MMYGPHGAAHAIAEEAMPVEQRHGGDPQHQEQQGPASLKQEGPGAGYSLKDLGQPVRTTNGVSKVRQDQKQERNQVK